MLVSISEAARMAGIKSRSTMYRHIKKKGITVTEDDDGNPQIDTSELIRVYGSKIKLPEEGANNKTPDTPKSKQVKQDNTLPNDLVELAVLRERIKHLEEAKEKDEAERRKERELLNDQVDNLKKITEEAQNQNRRLTALITDQSSQNTKIESARDDKISKLEETIYELKAQNDRLLKVEEERKRRVAERKRLAREEEEKRSRGLFKKLFSNS